MTQNSYCKFVINKYIVMKPHWISNYKSLKTMSINSFFITYILGEWVRTIPFGNAPKAEMEKTIIFGCYIKDSEKTAKYLKEVLKKILFSND